MATSYFLTEDQLTDLQSKIDALQNRCTALENKLQIKNKTVSGTTTAGGWIVLNLNRTQADFLSVVPTTTGQRPLVYCNPDNTYTVKLVDNNFNPIGNTAVNLTVYYIKF